MRRLLLALLAAAALAGCSTGAQAVDVNNGGEFRFVAGTPAGKVIPEGARAKAPAFSGTLLDGGAFSSRQLAGHIAVLNFWGSWCPPCRVETPQFQQVYAEVKDRGVQFLDELIGQGVELLGPAEGEDGDLGPGMRDFQSGHARHVNCCATPPRRRRSSAAA